MRALSLITILLFSSIASGANHRLCKEIEKINKNEAKYSIPLEQQVVFYIEEDMDNPAVLEFESGFLRCAFNNFSAKYSLAVKAGHAICRELEKINENEHLYNMSLEDQVVFSLEADGYNPEEIQTESGDLRCVRKSNGKWKAIIKN